MAVCQLLLVAAALHLAAGGAPAVEIDTLKGERHSGELVSLDATAIVLKTGEATAAVPLANVLEVRFPASPPPEASTGTRVALLDGTRLTVNPFSIAGDAGRCETAFGTLTIPVARLAHVRFGISTPKLDEAWAQLLARESKNDLLVVTKKDDVLDFLGGATGDVGGKGDGSDKIAFLLDGEEVQVARDKVHGIIFHRRAPSLPKAVGEVRLTGGDVLEVSRLTWNDGELKVRLVSGGDLAVPAARLAAIDFSSGKIRYLSALEPRDVKYVPFFDITHEYRRDRSLDGTPLTLAGKSWPRGLAIHSKTTLRYRIAGDYTRFQAVAGIDDSVRRGGKFNVRLIIKGDSQSLFDAEIKTEDAPRPIELDVSGVRDLEITIDFGSDMLDICDHLDLADAKLLK
jgi:hypothetical protein